MVPEWRLWVPALLWPVPARKPGSISATDLRSTTLAGLPGHSPQPPAAGALGSTGRPWEGRGKRAAFCWGTVREQLPCAGRSRGPKHCRAQKNGINIRKRTSLVTSLKRDYCCRGLVFFPFKTTHILKGAGAGEIQPFMLILSGHPEAGPMPAAALLAQAPATKGRAGGQGRVGRTAALLVSVKAEHRGWDVRSLKCRDARGASGLVLGLREGWATGSAPGRSCGTNADHEGCRAQSPFPWALLTLLLPGTVHSQQLPKENSGLKDMAHEGRKLV